MGACLNGECCCTDGHGSATNVELDTTPVDSMKEAPADTERFNSDSTRQPQDPALRVESNRSLTKSQKTESNRSLNKSQKADSDTHINNGSVGADPIEPQADDEDDEPKEDAGTGSGFNEVIDVPASKPAPARPSTRNSRSMRDADTGLVIEQTPMGETFPKRPNGCRLSSAFWAKAKQAFEKMDRDASNAVTRSEAADFFKVKCAFSTESVKAMFNEVDTDHSDVITGEEFMAFWLQVREAGYEEAELLEELEDVFTRGQTWVDFNDSRDPGKMKSLKFPKRPTRSKMTSETWKKCQDVFEAMDADGKMGITKDKAINHFKKGSFGGVSAQAMFNEVDENHHGIITPDMWMSFWQQVLKHNYTCKDLNEELDNLLNGGAWMDWKDDRTT